MAEAEKFNWKLKLSSSLKTITAVSALSGGSLCLSSNDAHAGDTTLGTVASPSIVTSGDLIIDGAADGTYTYDTNYGGTTGAIGDVGFLDADGDGIPVGASSGDNDDTNSSITTVSNPSISSGEINFIGGVSSGGVMQQADNGTADDNDDFILYIDNVGGTYSYDLGETGTASLRATNIIGQQGANNAGTTASNAISGEDGGESILYVEDIYSANINVIGGDGGGADLQDGGDGGDAKFRPTGAVTGNINLVGGNAGVHNGTSSSYDGGLGGNAVLVVQSSSSLSTSVINGNINMTNGQDANRDLDDTTPDDGGGKVDISFNMHTTVNGNVIPTDEGTGEISLLNTRNYVFNGDIGIVSEDGSATRIGSIEAKDLIIAGDLGANEMDVDDLIFFGNEAQYVSVFDNTTNVNQLSINDTITIDNNAGVYLFSDLKAPSTTVNENAKLSVGKDNDAESVVYNVEGALSIKQGGTLELMRGIIPDNPVTFESGSNLLLIGNLDGSGTDLAIDGELAINDSSGSFKITAPYLDLGEEIILGTVNSGSNITITNGKSDQIELDGGNFTKLDMTQDSNNLVILSSRNKTVQEVTEDLGLSSQQGGEIMVAVNDFGSSTDFATGSADNLILSAVEDTSLTPDEANSLVDQLSVQEEVLASVARSNINVSANSFAITNSRLASLRTGDNFQLAAANATAGFATGDGMMRNNFWGKLFISHGTQEGSDNVAAFDSASAGFVGGVDHSFEDGLVLGTAFTYSNSEVKGDGDGQSETDINQYQMMLYGGKTLTDLFIDWQAAIAKGTVDSGSVLDLSTGTSVATSAYDTRTYSLQFGGGTTIVHHADSVFTPYGNVNYTLVQSESYALDYDGTAADQTVSPEDVDTLTFTAGMKWDYQIELERGWLFKPQLRGALNYELLGDAADATALYSSGNSVKIQGEDSAPLGANLGTNISWQKDEMTMGFNVDTDVKSDYEGVTAAFNFKLLF